MFEKATRCPYSSGNDHFGLFGFAGTAFLNLNCIDLNTLALYVNNYILILIRIASFSAFMLFFSMFMSPLFASTALGSNFNAYGRIFENRKLIREYFLVNSVITGAIIGLTFTLAELLIGNHAVPSTIQVAAGFLMLWSVINNLYYLAKKIGFSYPAIVLNSMRKTAAGISMIAVGIEAMVKGHYWLGGLLVSCVVLKAAWSKLRQRMENRSVAGTAEKIANLSSLEKPSSGFHAITAAGMHKASLDYQIEPRIVSGFEI